MLRIILKNDFHRTSARITVNALSQDTGFLRADLTDAQARKVSRKLCPFPDCACGGIRGAQSHAGQKLIVWRVPVGWSTIAK